VVQNEENTRDGDFLVKPLACIAHKSTQILRDLWAMQASKIWSTHSGFVEVEALGQRLAAEPQLRPEIGRAR
jgi:hypothetical protein